MANHDMVAKRSLYRGEYGGYVGINSCFDAGEKKAPCVDYMSSGMAAVMGNTRQSHGNLRYDISIVD